jgi:intracellular septation protein
MTPQQRRWVRYAVDFSAPLVFIGVYFLGGRDFMKATYAVIGASLLAVVVGAAVERRLAPLPVFTGVTGAIFAALTLIFHAPWIFKVRPTIIYFALAMVLLGGAALGKRPIKAVLGEMLPLPDEAWKKLEIRFGLFYVLLAATNLAVWLTQSQDTWVAFDTIGLRIANAAFGLAQMPLLMKHMSPAEAPPPPDPD